MVTRAMSLRIRLTSNCLRLRDFTLESFFTFKHRLSKLHHPTKVEIDILGNKFSI